MVRTPALKSDSNHTLIAPAVSEPTGKLGHPEAIWGTEKSGQFSVRTHVRKMRQNLRKLRGMSGGLQLGGSAALAIGDLVNLVNQIQIAFEVVSLESG